MLPSTFFPIKLFLFKILKSQIPQLNEVVSYILNAVAQRTLIYGRHYQSRVRTKSCLKNVYDILNLLRRFLSSLYDLDIEQKSLLIATQYRLNDTETKENVLP